MTAEVESNVRHLAAVVDYCYGMTGGVKVQCSCGSYWVLRRNAHGHEIDNSILVHYKEKGQVTT